MTGRLAAALAAAALALSGCTHQLETVTPTPSATSPAPTPTAATPNPRPVAGACYQLTASDLALPTHQADPVDCRRPHTVETVRVLHASSWSESRASEACRRAVSRHVGAGRLELAATMVRWVWFRPADSTQKWLSCDLVVFADADGLVRLPRRTAQWYERARAEIAICGTAAPGSTGFERVVCSRRHSWRVLEAIPLSGSTYPGAAAVRKRGDQRCADAVRASQGFPLRFTYGWEWPTRRQWSAGQHYGLCWTAESP